MASALHVPPYALSCPVLSTLRVRWGEFGLFPRCNCLLHMGRVWPWGTVRSLDVCQTLNLAAKVALTRCASSLAARLGALTSKLPRGTPFVHPVDMLPTA